MEGIYLAYMLHRQRCRKITTWKKYWRVSEWRERKRRGKKKGGNSFSSDSIFTVEEEEDAGFGENVYEVRSDAGLRHGGKETIRAGTEGDRKDPDRAMGKLAGFDYRN